MTNLHPSTSLDLPNVIAKFALKGTSATLADGTVSYTFKGFVSSLDAHLFYLTAMTNDGFERNTKHHVIFNAQGKNYSWYVKQNYVPKGGKFYITFELNDYTVPDQVEKVAKKKEKNLEIYFHDLESANRWLENVILTPQHFHDHELAISDAIERILDCAQAIAKRI